MSLKEQLLNSDKLLGVWGIGYIGLSSMANFASNGVSCIGVDIDQQKVTLVNEGKMPQANMEYWLGFDIKPLVKAGKIRATTDYKELLKDDVALHLICIPTEKGGSPYNEILKNVFMQIASFKHTMVSEPPLIIIESTLTPNTTKEVVLPVLEQNGFKPGKDILVGVAPRRDWFISPEKNLRTLPRVVGGTTPETTELMADVLSIVCNTILKASDHRHAELVKSIENAFRHVDITLANQLSLAYSDIDMREVLRLVGTKWNIETYHPSFGTGGYCIPLSSQYVLSGTRHTEPLSILRAAIESDQKMPDLVAKFVIKRGAKKVGILGLAYRGDLKVHTLSPTIKITELLQKKGIEVKVHDPYYSAAEIEDILGTATFEFPSGLGEFDTVLLVSDHLEYRSTPQKIIIESLKNCKLLLNNTELWKNIDFENHGIEHLIAGASGWLK